MRVVFLATLAACLCFSASVSGTSGKAAAAQQKTNNSKADASDSKKGSKEKDKVNKKTKGDAIRVSQVLGMTVRNSQGKDSKKLGDVEDVMLEMVDHGRVPYAALSFGGFLGVGNKLFAVPWRVLKFHHDADRDKNYVVFDVTEERLRKTPGFDKDHWPNMADRRWMREADQYHGVDVPVGNRDVHVRIEARDKQTTDGMHQADPHFPLHRGSQVIGMEVKNAVGDKLGKVEDIVIGMHSADIRYLAMSFGGFLGIGDKLLAVPLRAVNVQHDPNHDEYFVLFDVTKDQLEKADGFDKDEWPDSGNDDWTSASHEDFAASADKNGK